MSLDLNTLRVRAITAAVFVAVLLGCIYISYYSFAILFFFVSIWALHEFFELTVKMGTLPFKRLGILCGILVFLSFYSRHFSNAENSPSIFLIQNAFYLVPFLLAIKFLFSKNDEAFNSYVYTIAGIFYCTIPFALLVQIPISNHVESVMNLGGTYNYFIIFGIFLLIWANDTFAYLGGSLFGKNKMYEKVSPGKTWEGTLIGVVLCITVGCVLNMKHIFNSNWIWPLIAMVVGVLGTIGDLIESKLKRKAGVKDSGRIMPGHGGILDRFDSLMFASPFAYLIIKAAEHLI